MVQLAKITLTEETELGFGLNVFGTSESPSTIKFVIEGKDFELAFNGEFVNGEVKVTLPKLKGILESGEYPVRLDVLVGEKLFSPLKETIEITPLVEFDVSKIGAKKRVAEGVEVQIKSSTSKQIKPTNLQENIQKLHEEGYEVVEMNGFNVIKSADSYVGFVSENGVVKSKKSYAILSDLVDSMMEER